MALTVDAVVDPLKTWIGKEMTDYVHYIIKYGDNMDKLSKKLRELCCKKETIDEKRRRGEQNLEKVTSEVASWLRDLRLLTEDEDLKDVMSKEIKIAKIVVKMMEPKDLKKLVKEDSKMQEVVVKVMQKIQEELKEIEEEKNKPEEEQQLLSTEDEGDLIALLDKVITVVEGVIKETTEGFKKLIKDDPRLALVVTKSLKTKHLDKLTKDDEELANIVKKIASDHHNDEPQETDHQAMPAEKKMIVQTAKYLLKPLGKLIESNNLRDALPENVKLPLDIIHALWKSEAGFKEVAENTKRHRKCCCCAVVVGFFLSRHDLSVAAEKLAKSIEEDMITRVPHDPVTLPLAAAELIGIPSRFVNGLETREKLLQQIVEALKSDQVNAVGLTGMGGIGKSTLAKELTRERSQHRFSAIVMVEVSEVPNIVHIQDQIAEQLDLSLHDVHNLPQRATMLYNRIMQEKAKGSKYGSNRGILIVLDNIWQILHLDDVGIPSLKANETWCKLLLTTREEGVCKAMGLEESNLFEIGLLDEKEAWFLFRKHIGRSLEDKEYEDMACKLLEHCGRLPLAIAGTANALKGKDLSEWRYFVSELEKPLSNHMSGMHRETYSVLEISYNLIESKEKKRFFLLACLFPLGSSILIEDLMRYGIGLGLFQNVNNLAEAMELAKRWAHELVSSSLLLEDVGSQGYVRIHDVVRASAISFAAKEGQVYVLQTIPQWVWEETCQKYTAISLMPGHNHSHVGKMSEINCDRLEMLLLNGSEPSTLPANFFDVTTSLKVLVLTDMYFKKGLPESMGKLKDLRTLHLEKCVLGDIGLILMKLQKLLVLSLRGSVLDALPEEIKNMHSLRLLDLSKCSVGNEIPFRVIRSLSQLEGLYMCKKFEGWANIEPSSGEGGSILGQNYLSHLTALEIHFQDIDQLPINDENFVKNLDQFSVSVGHHLSSSPIRYRVLTLGGSVKNSDPFFPVSVGHHLSVSPLSRRVLTLQDFDLSRIIDYNCLKTLLSKTECLQIQNGKGVKHLMPNRYLDEQGFEDLKHLVIESSPDMECIISTGRLMKLMKCYGWSVLPYLESLHLENLKSLKMICDGPVTPPRLWSKLQFLSLQRLPKLGSYVLPISPFPKLAEIHVNSSSYDLKSLFMEQASEITTVAIHVLPALKVLKLEKLISLETLLGEAQSSNLTLLSVKIRMPSLEILDVHTIGIVKLWDSPPAEETHTTTNTTLPGVIPYVCSFQRLKNVEISQCGALKCLGHPSVAVALSQLERLSISACPGLKEIFMKEAESLDKKVIRFENLKFLCLKSLYNLECFYRGSYELEFPTLQELVLDLPFTNTFDGSENCRSFFSEKIEFPMLEVLFIRVSKRVEKLWHVASEGAISNTTFTTKRSPIPRLQELDAEIVPMLVQSLQNLTLHLISECPVLIGHRAQDSASSQY